VGKHQGLSPSRDKPSNGATETGVTPRDLAHYEQILTKGPMTHISRDNQVSQLSGPLVLALVRMARRQ
jgi:hypothetical protein